MTAPGLDACKNDAVSNSSLDNNFATVVPVVAGGTRDDWPNGDCFTALPDVILFKIFGDGYLNAGDVLNCSKLNTAMASWFYGSSSSPSAAAAATTTTTTNNDDDDHARGLLWKTLLRQEGLPGETLHDLEGHIHDWDMYRDELRKALFHVAGVYKLSTSTASKEQQQQLCHKFLARAIPAYTYWVSNSHSWYKHLPTTGNSSRFEFFCDLRANMRHINNDGSPQWVDFEEGDGTRFHYTWMPTKKYQQLFGNFYYRLIRENTPPTPMSQAGYCNGTLVHIPQSNLVSGVSVTAVIHDSSPGWDHYGSALAGAIGVGSHRDPALELGVLPVEAADDLKAIAEACIAYQYSSSGPTRVEQLNKQLQQIWRERFQKLSLEDINDENLFTMSNRSRHANNKDGEDDSNEVYREIIGKWARVVSEAQRYRERAAIGCALHEVCVRCYGREWVPALDEVATRSATCSRRRALHWGKKP